MQRIVHGSVLQGVRHHHHGGVVDMDGLNAERRIAGGTRARGDGWRGRIIKRTRTENLRWIEAGVVNLDLAGPEIGGQKKTAGRVFDQRQTFIHRAGSG